MVFLEVKEVRDYSSGIHVGLTLNDSAVTQLIVKIFQNYSAMIIKNLMNSVKRMFIPFIFILMNPEN